MRKTFYVALVVCVFVLSILGTVLAIGAYDSNYSAHMMHKPVIYLYPEETTNVTVRLEYDGQLTHTYPFYGGEWGVRAEPDGTLYDGNREYYCLFWEGESSKSYSFDEGFCVKGADTAVFLERALRVLGLSDKEANEFIIYWAPQMEGNEYNLISFVEAEDRLIVTPMPDTVIQVTMVWKPVTDYVDVTPQVLLPVERTGFVVVEWGGSRIDA